MPSPNLIYRKRKTAALNAKWMGKTQTHERTKKKNVTESENVNTRSLTSSRRVVLLVRPPGCTARRRGIIFSLSEFCLLCPLFGLAGAGVRRRSFHRRSFYRSAKIYALGSACPVSSLLRCIFLHTVFVHAGWHITHTDNGRTYPLPGMKATNHHRMY